MGDVRVIVVIVGVITTRGLSRAAGARLYDKGSFA